MKRLLLLLILPFLYTHLHAQEKKVQGIVFDRADKQRLNRVYIYNTRTNKGFYNTTKGEFSTTVIPGDTLVAALEGYGVDTVRIRTQNTILFYLRRTSIVLQEVPVTDTVNSPDKELAEKKKAYGDIYRKGNTKDIFTTGGSNGAGGAGLSIDMLYNLLSREGRNARFLQKIIERDYRESMISYRYTASLVGEVTGLGGDKLADFMQQYRPTYNFVIEANDYELIRFIKSSYQTYLQNPGANRLPPLKAPNQ